MAPAAQGSQEPSAFVRQEHIVTTDCSWTVGCHTHITHTPTSPASQLCCWVVVTWQQVLRFATHRSVRQENLKTGYVIEPASVIGAYVFSPLSRIIFAAAGLDVLEIFVAAAHLWVWAGLEVRHPHKTTYRDHVVQGLWRSWARCG